MSSDLAALAPSAIICVAFLAGAWLLLRRELAPKRRARRKADAASGDRAPGADSQGRPSRKSLYFTASTDYVVSSTGIRDERDAEMRCGEIAHSIARSSGRYVNCVPLA